MRTIVVFVLVGLALMFLGAWVLVPTPDIGGPGERPTSPSVYAFYAGLASLALAALLIVRGAWLSDPGAPAIIFFFAVGFILMTLGAGLRGRGDPTGPIVFVSGVGIQTLAAAVTVRKLLRRARSRSRNLGAGGK